jgi:hypothetical protein
MATTAEPLTSSNSNGTSHDGPVELTQPFDSSVFRSYLLALLPPVLGASQTGPESIFDEGFDERVSRFAGEGGVVVYVVKVKDEADGVQDIFFKIIKVISYFFQQTMRPQPTLHLSYSPSHVTSLALITRALTLDPLAPLATQLHMLNLFGGDETPYEGLHAVVSSGIKPWFDAFVGTRGAGKDDDSKLGEYINYLFLSLLWRAVTCHELPFV